MRDEHHHPLKSMAIWWAITAGGVITAYIAFISVISIWVGITRIHQTGSWVPILVGTFILGVALWVYVRAAAAIHSHLKTRELFDL